MSLQIEIPDEISQAMRLPIHEQPKRLLLELAVTLYAQEILSFGKARELAGLGKYEFGKILGERKVPRHARQTPPRTRRCAVEDAGM